MADDDDKVVDLAARRKRAVEHPRWTDEKIVTEFGDRQLEMFRFVDDWGQWRYYSRDHGLWLRDETNLVRSEIRMLLVELSDGLKVREVMRMQSVAMMSGIERMARTEQRLAAIVEDWDADQQAINCRGMVYQLEED